MMKQLKSFLFGIMVFGVGLSTVFAAKLSGTTINQPHTNCDGGTFPVVYYAGYDGFYMTDTFQSADTRYAWNFKPSSFKVYNPNGLMILPTGLSNLFPFISNGKPGHINSVIVTQSAGKIKIGRSMPSSWRNRNNIAAQVVFKINRSFITAKAGTENQIKYVKEGTTSQQQYTYDVDVSNFHAGDKTDYECRNIHVGFCGDGILDNSNKTSSTTINTPLKGGEQCDPEDDSETGWGNAGCSATCTPINVDAPVCSSTYNGKTHYGQNWLSSSTPGLCAKGTVSNFTGPNANGRYTWKCANTVGEKVNCNADENWCGDGVKQSNESCDYNDPNKTGRGTANPGCNTICKPANKAEPQIGISKEINFQSHVNEGQRNGITMSYKISVTNFNNPENPVVIDKLPNGMCFEFTSDIDTDFVSISTDNGQTWTKETATINCDVTHVRYILTDAERKKPSLVFYINGLIPEENYIDGQQFCNHVVYSADDIQYEEDDVCTTLYKEKEYDLALKKTVSEETPGPYQPGDVVVFDITIYNQGDIKAENIEITDYIPEGLEVIDPNWIVNGNVAVTNKISKNNEEFMKCVLDVNDINVCRNKYLESEIKGLNPGEKVTISIVTKIKDNFTGTTIKNIAEISKDNGDDIDSTPDQNPDNECGIVDDMIDGKCDTDEDDHDIVVITVGREELSISKRLLGNKIYTVGEEVKFRVEVNNGGTLAVNNLLIKDFMPESLSYVSTKIVSNHTATLTTGIDGDSDDFSYSNLTLSAGETFVFEVIGKVKDTPDQTQTTNCATVKTYRACDKFSLTPKPELDKTQRVNNSGSYVDATLDVKNSDTINYRIVFKNTGSATSHNTILTDKLPRCVSYVDGTAQIDLPSGYKFVKTVEEGADKLTYSNFDMKPGQTVILTLDARIKNKENCASDDYKNTAILRFGDEILTDDVVVKPVKEKVECETVDGDDNVIIIYDDEAETRFRCRTKNNGNAEKMRIDCGNGRYSPWEYNTSNVSYICEYRNRDKGTNKVTCEVYSQDNEKSICNDSVYVDESRYGVCGNGRKDAGEDCDRGGKRKRLYDRDDKLFEFGSSRYDLDRFLDREDENYSNSKEYECTRGCRIKIEGGDFVAEIPKCLSTNTAISVSQDEELPFRWRLEKGKIKITNSCDEEDNIDSDYKTSIREKSLKCTFKVYNASKNTDEYSHGSERDSADIDSFVLEGDDCYKASTEFESSSKQDDIYKYFYDTNNNKEYAKKWNYDWHINKANGLHVIDIDDYFNKGGKQYGEYKLTLEKVEYEYCNPNTEEREDGQLYDRVCEVNFTVTKPYLIQKGLYGLFPVGSTEYTKFFKNFYEIRDSNALFRGNSLKYLDSTTVTNDTDYKITSELQKNIDAFKNKYKKLAVKYDGNVSKVPGKNIFFVKGNVELDGNKYVTTKYTMVVDGTVTVKGSIKTNGMIIANNIKFVDGGGADGDFRCEEGGQTVQGIFIATNRSGGFSGDADGNKNKNGEERCNYGNLKVKGVLIGNGIKDLVKDKRSHLNGWFWVKPNGHNESKVKAERRGEIFNGAAVLIEYNPYLWTDLPPGAKDFINALSIYKS